MFKNKAITNNKSMVSKQSRNYVYILWGVFLIMLILKLVISFQTPFLSYDSYFHLSNTKFISQGELQPIFQTSYQDNMALPLIDYGLAFFSLFVNLEIIAKILSAIISALIIVVVFYIVKEITKKEKIALITAGFSAFIPLFFVEFTNRFSNTEISILVFLVTLYFFIKTMSNTFFIKHFIVSLVLLILLTPLALIFILTFGIYFLMLASERMKIRMSEIETFLFSLILGGWLYILIYQTPIITTGIFVFLNRTSQNLISVYSPVELISLIGIVPLILGVMGMYYVLVKKLNRKLIFVSSLLIVSLVVSLFNLVNQIFGVIILSLSLILLSGSALSQMQDFFEITKVKKTFNVLFIFIILLFILTSVIPSITGSIIKSQDTLTEDDWSALNWIKENTAENSLILSSIEESYLVNYYAERGNIFNAEILSKSIGERSEDVEKVYGLSLNTEAIRILTYYEIDYIFLSQKTIDLMNPQEFAKFDDPCYERVFAKGGARVYKRLCEIKEELEINKELFE